MQAKGLLLGRTPVVINLAGQNQWLPFCVVLAYGCAVDGMRPDADPAAEVPTQQCTYCLVDSSSNGDRTCVQLEWHFLC